MTGAREKMGLDDAIVNGMSFHEMEACTIDPEIEQIDYPLVRLELNKRFAVLEAEGLILDFVTGQALTAYSLVKVVAATYKYRDADGKQHSAAARWLDDPERRSFRERKFMPGLEPEAGGILNTWPGFAVKPIKTDKPEYNASWFTLLVRIMLGYLDPQGEEEARRFIQWCAWPFAHPTESKILRAWILWSALRGVGKGLLARALMALYGRSLALSLSPAVFRSAFDGAAENAMFTVLDEADNSTKTEGGSAKLKQLVTEPVLVVNPKYGRQKTITNHANVLITSNHPNPVKIDGEAERRFEVREIKSRPLSPWFAEHVAANIKSEQSLGELLYYFQNCVDFSDFDPTAPARRGEDFYQVVDAGLNAAERFVAEAMAGSVESLAFKDIYHLDEIAAAAPDDARRAHWFASAVRNALQRRGAVALRPTKVGGVTKRLWAIRDAEKWKNAGGAEIANEYLQGRKAAKY